MLPPLIPLFCLLCITQNTYLIHALMQEGLLTMAVPEDRPEVAALVPKISIPVVLVTKARLPTSLLAGCQSPLVLGATAVVAAIVLRLRIKNTTGDHYHLTVCRARAIEASACCSRAAATQAFECPVLHRL